MPPARRGRSDDEEADPGLLERLSGLADLKGAVDGAAWAEADEF